MHSRESTGYGADHRSQESGQAASSRFESSPRHDMESILVSNSPLLMKPWRPYLYGLIQG